MTNPTHLKFNPDCMTVSDLKKCADTLRGLLIDYDRNKENWEEAGRSVAQFRNAFVID